MQPKIGERRKFTFDKKFYTIREILDQPLITMFWSYDTGICPHCKKRLVNDVEYIFTRIEVLGIQGIQDENLTEDTIQLYGQTVDNRGLIISIDKYDEVFDKSEKFKKLKKVK